MSKPSWVEKVSGEKDRWIRASRLEKEGDLEGAAKLYVEEAAEQERSRNEAMAALCYLSAAKCMAKAGRNEEATKLFSKAAFLYEGYADKALSISPSSAAWGYEMASKSFAWAGEYDRARAASAKAEAISEKIGREVSKEGYPIFRPYRRREGDKGKD